MIQWFWNLICLRGLPRPMQIVIYALIGVALGGGILVARLGNALSYLSDSPETCMNCHVMTDAYLSWQRGSHARVALCNDCHVPHDNPVAKYAFKARDGMKHSAVFTLRTEPQVLELSHGARPVVQSNCLHCHADQFAMIRLADQTERACWDCHQGFHGIERSQSSSPHILRPSLPDAGLDIMKSGANP